MRANNTAAEASRPDFSFLRGMLLLYGRDGSHYANPCNLLLTLARVATVMLATLRHYYLAYSAMFIGALGWGEILLPISYYYAGAVALIVAAVTTMLGLKGERVGYRSMLPSALGVFVSVAALFGSLYLVWTPPDYPTVEGAQGRYFLPIALAGMALFPALGHARLARIQNWLLPIVLLFPALSLTVMMRAIVLRYYLH